MGVALSIPMEWCRLGCMVRFADGRGWADVLVVSWVEHSAVGGAQKKSPPWWAGSRGDQSRE